MVAKDFYKHQEAKDRKERILKAPVQPEECRPEFVTAVGTLNSCMPSKFQLKLDHAKTTVLTHMLL
jgi:hypothetical protein